MFIIMMILIAVLQIMAVIILIFILIYGFKWVRKHVLTAKANYEMLLEIIENVPESNLEEVELKLKTIQNCKINFATGWIVFWFIFGIIGAIISIFTGYSNFTARRKYKDQEYERLIKKQTLLLK